jgi:cytochrome c oxidase cbb3-type subunit III
MSLRFRSSLLPPLALALLCGCDREERQTRGKPLPETIPASATMDRYASQQRAEQYEENAAAIAKGQQLYSWMNCAGCHHHGGGGMGVPLMDGKWVYGGQIEQVAASIRDGRPGGMPAWQGRITEQQIWQLAAFVRAMSGQLRKDAVTARNDEMSNVPPLTQMAREPILQQPARP